AKIANAYRTRPARLGTRISRRGGGALNARVGSLARYEKNNRKAEPQAAFLEVEPRATRPDSWPLPGKGILRYSRRASAWEFCPSQSQTWMELSPNFGDGRDQAAAV